MILTKDQQALLDGQQGEIMAKVVKTLVMYGEASVRKEWCLLPVSMATRSSALVSA